MAKGVSRRVRTAEARVRTLSVYLGYVVDNVALGQVFPGVLRFSLVNYIPPVLHYMEKLKKTDHLSLIFITGLHTKP